MSRVPAILLPDFDDRDDVARAALRRWTERATDLALVSRGANFTYRFVDGGRRRYLRLVPPGWRTRAELAGEVAFMEHLRTRGVPLSAPVATSAGAFVVAAPSSAGECHALVFEAVEGHAEDDVHWTPEQAYEAGRLMARMHVASYRFSLPPGTSRPSWRDEFVALERELPESETDLWDIIHEARALFETLPPTPDSYGVVHFDLSGDNIVWRGLSPAAIDFDDCLTHWYIADITRTVAYFREQARGAVGAQERAFMEGYEMVRPLGDAWQALLPRFLRLALISELAWVVDAGDDGAVEFAPGATENLRAIIAGMEI
ncbi:MAG TPA: phosphotransferase [Dehalococcoidia bacterium]|nr:phosphotransferase [Dehalococcoidia bacterium]